MSTSAEGLGPGSVRSLRQVAALRVKSSEPQMCGACYRMDLAKSLLPPSPESIRLKVFLKDLSDVILSGQCPLCRLVLRALEDTPGFEDLTWERSAFVHIRPVPFAFNTHVGARLPYWIARAWLSLHVDRKSWTVWKTGTSHFRGIQLLCDQNEPQSSQLAWGRQLQADGINFGMIKQWILQCTDTHQDTCSPLAPEAYFPFRLIDVRQRRVLNAQIGSRYAALSYVWGDAKQLMLSAESYEDLTSRRALRDTRDDLPQTIKDALLLCERINIPYLWVDALCIQQDDEADKNVQIDNMDTVYSRATLTLIVGVGQAGTGADAHIPGVRSGSRYRPQVIAAVDNNRFCIAHEPYLSALETSQWFTRGWTLQELYLSRRVLLLANSQVFFHCSKGVFSEDVIWEYANSDNLQPTWDNYHSRQHCFIRLNNDDAPVARWCSYVKGYSLRHLTYEKDTVKAFTGIANSFREQLPGNFVYGHPEWIFDLAMTWSCTEYVPSNSRHSIPTWSWMCVPTARAMRIIIASHTAHDIRSEVVWYAKKNGTIRLERIENGGTVESKSGLNRLWRPTDTQTNPPLAGDYEGFEARCLLCFWTSVGFVRVARTQKNETYSSTLQVYYLLGADNSRISSILLDDAWKATRPDALQFMVICSTEPESPEIVQLGSSAHYQSGVILQLIEWRDGIAHRIQRVNGVVTHEAWASINPAWKFVMLD